MNNDYFGKKLKKIIIKASKILFKENIKTGESKKVLINRELLDKLRRSFREIETSSKLIDKILLPFENIINEEIEIKVMKSIFYKEMMQILKPFAYPIDIDYQLKPQVVVVCGINGSGKTTTIGKMAYMLNKFKWKTSIIAGDDSRPSAKEQLLSLIKNTDITVIKKERENEKISNTVERGYDITVQNNSDVLLIDTGGCITLNDLEEKNIPDIIQKLHSIRYDSPHNIIMIIDATNGINSIGQIKKITEKIGINGLVVTKLDQVTKTGLLLSLADELKLPIHGVGIGNGLEDLQDFSASEFIEAILGGI